jgi:L-seryl-tRNA(Ser) seleniumtransferase
VPQGVNDRLRELPGVDHVIGALGPIGAPRILSDAARRAVDSARKKILAGGAAPSFDDVVAAARGNLESQERSLLSEVINATGVLVHTNLGRAPLGFKQLDAVASVAGGYSNLEYDLVKGVRGNRYEHATALLTTLTGAESALVVNNNAAAVLLVLSALCSGRDVIISRGELIEIGGEFRMPDVMNQSGARLKEIGTTNRTHLADYERAITPEVAAIMKVHPSNYRMVGFTASVAARDLARLARGRGVLFINDLGSGLIDEADMPEAFRDEPLVNDAVGEGADIVTFSGDKLLGGPQAGIILGRPELIASISKHPLLRALRVDKMTLAALEATISSYLDGARHEIPLWAMLHTTTDDLRARADRIARSIRDLPKVKAEVIPMESVTGGGSLPNGRIASWGIAFTHSEANSAELTKILREGSPPVIGRIEDDRLLLDMRSVLPTQDELLEQSLANALETNS